MKTVRFVEDGKIATSGGLTSDIDLAMRVVERYLGRDAATEAARTLEYQARAGCTAQQHQVRIGDARGPAERPLCPVCEMQIEKKVDIADR